MQSGTGRRRRGATLAGLAAETGLTSSTLSRLETGRLRPTLEQLLPLARAHGVEIRTGTDLAGRERYLVARR